MKTIRIILAAIGLVIMIYTACNHTNQDENTTPSNKDIHSHDFNGIQSDINSDSAVLYYTDYHFVLDTMAVGETQSCVFNYTNKGKAPLLISNNPILLK